MSRIRNAGLALTLLGVAFTAPAAASALSIQSVGQGSPGLTAQAMATALAGSGVTVQPGATYTGVASASGTFSGAGDPYPSSGVALTTGNLGMLSTALPGYARSTNTGAAGDATASDPLGTGPSVPTFDASILSFTIVPVSAELTLDYVFGSNEYETSGSRADDRVAIKIGNAPSCAVVPGTSTIVSVLGIDETHNAGLLRLNTGSPRPFAPIDISGLTTALRCTAHVTPGVAVPVKLVVAETIDHLNDSAVLFTAGSLRSNSPPVAVISATSPSGKAPRPVSFSTAGSTDPDGAATISSWSLTFGDGGSTGGSGPPPATIAHTYSGAGAFTATLTLTDDRGDVASSNQAVSIQAPNVAPRAGFTVSPSAPQAGSDITLQSTATDPDGTVAATTWDLNNDGTYGDAVGPTAVTRFAAPGVYVLHERVTDDDGASSDASVSVTVTAPPLPIVVAPPAVALLTKSPALQASAAGVTSVQVKCVGSSACNGQAELTVPHARASSTHGRARVTVIATRRYRLAAGRTGRLVLTLTRLGRRLLTRAHGRLRVTLTLVPSTHGAKTISTVTTLRVKPSRH